MNTYPESEKHIVNATIEIKKSIAVLTEITPTTFQESQLKGAIISALNNCLAYQQIISKGISGIIQDNISEFVTNYTIKPSEIITTYN